MSTVVALAAVLFFLWVVAQAPPIQRALRRRSRTTKLRRLRRRYQRLLGLTQEKADEVIDRQLADLRQRYPGKSELWRMRKLLSDLERARR